MDSNDTNAKGKTMTLATIRNDFATMTDDADSAGFFKKWEAVKTLTNARLVDLVREAHAVRYPGCSQSSKLHRMWKLELVSYLAWLVA